MTLGQSQLEIQHTDATFGTVYAEEIEHIAGERRLLLELAVGLD
jgi:hypothetical protein